ncbi:MAG: hypothetical protein HY298_02705 [Verrucomicrobia bacterium]|nr:hypothetical protein [Verrucomicrobiota bacterium]
MKGISVLIVVLTAYLTCFGQNAPLEQLGRPFFQTNINLIWNAPTNHLPRALWVYRALPSEVSPAVISNLLALGSFTTRDRKKVPGYPHTISYADPSGKRTLWIVPEWSDIRYRDSDADDMKIAEGVPDKQQAFELATNYLSKLGIEHSQLGRKPDSFELRPYFNEGKAMLYHHKGEPAYATNLHMRGVVLMRALDGVEFYGGSARGGCTIEFGHHSRICQIDVAWRKFKRDKLYAVAEPEKLLKWIRTGTAVWQSSPEWRSPDWSSARKMTITKVTPFYYGEARSEFDKPQNRIDPFAQLEATLDTGKTNFPILVNCPILEEKPLR